MTTSSHLYYHAKEKIKKPRRSFEEMWEEIINESHELPEKKDTKISMSDFLDAVLSDDDTAADSLFKQRPYMDI